MPVRAEQIAVSALRDWWLQTLPARVATVNGTRAPVLKSPRVEPFVVTSGMSLSVSADSVDGAGNPFALTTGTRTAQEIADDLSAAVPGGSGFTATADSSGHVLMTGGSMSSVRSLSLAPDPTGANALLGFDPGGEKVAMAPLVAPSFKGIADGLPVLPDMGQGFWVILGKRSSLPVTPVMRRDEYLVTVDVGILHRETNVQVNRSREHIHSVVRCLRECLLTDEGRRLGRGGIGDIVLVMEKSCLIDGTPFSFRGGSDGGPPPPNGLFDRAFMQLSIRVFERPDAT